MLYRVIQLGRAPFCRVLGTKFAEDVLEGLDFYYGLRTAYSLNELFSLSVKTFRGLTVRGGLFTLGSFVEPQEGGSALIRSSSEAVDFPNRTALLEALTGITLKEVYSDVSLSGDLTVEKAYRLVQATFEWLRCPVSYTEL